MQSSKLIFVISLSLMLTLFPVHGQNDAAQAAFCAECNFEYLEIDIAGPVITGEITTIKATPIGQKTACTAIEYTLKVNTLVIETNLSGIFKYVFEKIGQNELSIMGKCLCTRPFSPPKRDES